MVTPNSCKVLPQFPRRHICIPTPVKPVQAVGVAATATLPLITVPIVGQIEVFLWTIFRNSLFREWNCHAAMRGFSRSNRRDLNMRVYLSRTFHSSYSGKTVFLYFGQKGIFKALGYAFAANYFRLLFPVGAYMPVVYWKSKENVEYEERKSPLNLASCLPKSGSNFPGTDTLDAF